MIRLLFALLLMSASASAETVFAARTIPAQAIIGPADLMIKELEMSGAVTNPSAVLGQEARTVIYAGRPIRQADVRQPAVLDRNQLVLLIYQSGGLMIATEGRSLGRAGIGESVRVMNLASRTTVFARVGEDGHAYVTRFDP